MCSRSGHSRDKATRPWHAAHCGECHGVGPIVQLAAVGERIDPWFAGAAGRAPPPSWSSSSLLLDAVRTRRCSRWVSLFVFISGRALAALRLLCFDFIRICRSAGHRAMRFLPCTAATAMTALLAPVRQEAARSRVAPSDSPSATVPTLAALWESALSLVCSRCLSSHSSSRPATAGHVHMALSRSPAAAGIVPPRQCTVARMDSLVRSWCLT